VDPASIALELGCIRLREARRELRIEPRYSGGPFAFQTQAFVATHRTHGDHFPPEVVTRVRDATLAWEESMRAVPHGLEQMPAMLALHLLRLHLAGRSLEGEAREVNGRGHARDIDDQVRAICANPPVALRGGAHVLVHGPGRSGTRWVLDSVSRVLSLACPTLTFSRPLVGEGWEGPDGQSSWNRGVARCNAYFPPSEANAVERALATIDPIRSVALVCPPSVTIVSKTGRGQSLRQWASVFPGIHALLVLRDPRNVFLSRRHFQPERLPRAAGLVSFLVAYLAQTLARRVLRSRGSRFVLRYEDMRADLHGELVRLASWLGVPASADALTPIARELSFEVMSGRPYGEMRDGAYYRGGSDWTRELTQAEKLIASLFDPFIERLGYPPAGA
jgi:hypothetical protein